MLKKRYLVMIFSVVSVVQVIILLYFIRYRLLNIFDYGIAFLFFINLLLMLGILAFFLRYYEKQAFQLKNINMNYNLMKTVYVHLKSLNGINDKEEVYVSILKTASMFIPAAEMGSIMVLKHGRYHFEAAIGLDSNYLDLIEMKPEDVNLFKETKGKMDRGALIDDVMKSNFLGTDEETKDLLTKGGSAKIRSTMSVPIKNKDKVIGLLNLDSTKVNAFREEDLQVLELFGIEAAKFVKLFELMESNIKMSRYDELTQIYNRGYTSRQIKKMILDNKAFILVMIDLNDLKAVNDVHGHDMGDILIQGFVNHMKLFLKEDVLFCRYGGDEFLCVFPEYELLEVQVMIEDAGRFLQTYPIPGKDGNMRVSFSYGMVKFPDEQEDYDELLKVADYRMYEMKRYYKKDKDGQRRN